MRMKIAIGEEEKTMMRREEGRERKKDEKLKKMKGKER